MANKPFSLGGRKRIFNFYPGSFGVYGDRVKFFDGIQQQNPMGSVRLNFKGFYRINFVTYVCAGGAEGAKVGLLSIHFQGQTQDTLTFLEIKYSCLRWHLLSGKCRVPLFAANIISSWHQATEDTHFHGAASTFP